MISLKKILFIYDHMTRLGGVQTVINSMTKELLYRGFDVTLLSQGRESKFKYPYLGKVIRIKKGHRHNPFSDVIYKHRISRVLPNYDLIVDCRAKSSDDFVMTLLADMGLLSKTIFRVENARVEIYLGTDYQKTQAIVSQAKATVCFTQEMKDLIVEKYGLDNVCVLPNPIALEQIDHKKQAQIPDDLPDQYILAAGRLNKAKGFDILINAYKDSKLDRTGIPLVILGEGDERPFLEEKIVTLGLEGKVILRGFDTNPFVYTNCALFYVMSSRREGFPLSLIENLHCGLPVVSFNCKTGPVDIIENESNGLLVEPVCRETLMQAVYTGEINQQDVIAFREAMDRMYLDKTLFETTKANAKASVEKYNIEIIADQWEELFL